MRPFGSSGAELAAEAPRSAASGLAALDQRLGRWVGLLWAGLAYVLFVASLARFVAFVNGLGNRGIDDGPVGGLGLALSLDALLVLALGLPGALMSRPWFERGWARVIPTAVRRSTEVAAVGLLLSLVVAQWRSVPVLVWHVVDPLLRAAVWGAAAFGWTLVVGSTFTLDHLEVFGVKQAWRRFQGRPAEAASFHARWVYRFVRRPLLVGLLVGLWAAPTLSLGRALLAGLLTLLIAASRFLAVGARRGALEADEGPGSLPYPGSGPPL